VLRSADDCFPLLGGELVARKHEAHVIIKNFGCCPGQGAKTIVSQHGQVVGQRHAGEFDAVDDLHWRKGMNVHARNGELDRPQNIPVIERL